MLITAFNRTLKDETLLVEAGKQLLRIDLFSAAESEKIIDTIYAAPPELIRKLKDVVD